MIYYSVIGIFAPSAPVVGQTATWTAASVTQTGIVRYVSSIGATDTAAYEIMLSMVSGATPPSVNTVISGTSPVWSTTAESVLSTAHIRNLEDLETGTAKIVNCEPITVDSGATELATKAYADSGGLFVQRVKGTSAVTNTSNTVGVDITGLSFPIVRYTMYQFRFMGLYRSSNTSAGAAFAFTGPSTNYCSWSVGIRTGAAGTAHFYRSSATALTTVTGTAAQTIPASATDYLWEIDGMLQCSVSGTLQLRCFAPNADGRTLTIQAGSMGTLTRVN